jgi:hypothetical protein
MGWADAVSEPHSFLMNAPRSWSSDGVQRHKVDFWTAGFELLLARSESRFQTVLLIYYTGLWYSEFHGSHNQRKRKAPTVGDVVQLVRTLPCRWLEARTVTANSLARFSETGC